MRIYLDVSCLNRPFDDQRQPRIRLESEAVQLILEYCGIGVWTQVSSAMASIEIDAMPDQERRGRVRLQLPDDDELLTLDETLMARAAALESSGFKPADAVHVAAAEALHADVFLSCDDRLCRRAARLQKQLRVKVDNPLAWVRENLDASDT